MAVPGVLDRLGCIKHKLGAWSNLTVPMPHGAYGRWPLAALAALWPLVPCPISGRLQAECTCAGTMEYGISLRANDVSEHCRLAGSRSPMHAQK